MNLVAECGTRSIEDGFRDSPQHFERYGQVKPFVGSVGGCRDKESKKDTMMERVEGVKVEVGKG